MSDPLPRLTAAELDPATLDALFADLEACTEVDQVLIKGGAGRNADAVATLAVARAALAAGARGVQIRYRWRDGWWFDTLMRTPTGVRLVRMPVPEAT
ncbi:MAG: hypothetical protein J0M02_08565 [Planctomycetes bacterium]|nr:hypothetical protein [Planctomycetota bacterium]